MNLIQDNCFILVMIIIILGNLVLLYSDFEMIKAETNKKGWVEVKIWWDARPRFGSGGRIGGKRYYFVEYIDVNGEERRCRCRASTEGVDWNVPQQ